MFPKIKLGGVVIAKTNLTNNLQERKINIKEFVDLYELLAGYSHLQMEFLFLNNLANILQRKEPDLNSHLFFRDLVKDFVGVAKNSNFMSEGELAKKIWALNNHVTGSDLGRMAKKFAGSLKLTFDCSLNDEELLFNQPCLAGEERYDSYTPEYTNFLKEVSISEDEQINVMRELVKLIVGKKTNPKIIVNYVKLYIKFAFRYKLVDKLSKNFSNYSLLCTNFLDFLKNTKSISEKYNLQLGPKDKRYSTDHKLMITSDINIDNMEEDLFYKKYQYSETKLNVGCHIDILNFLDLASKELPEAGNYPKFEEDIKDFVTVARKLLQRTNFMFNEINQKIIGKSYYKEMFNLALRVFTLTNDAPSSLWEVTSGPISLIKISDQDMMNAISELKKQKSSLINDHNIIATIEHILNAIGDAGIEGQVYYMSELSQAKLDNLQNMQKLVAEIADTVEDKKISIHESFNHKIKYRLITRLRNNSTSPNEQQIRSLEDLLFPLIYCKQLNYQELTN